MNSSSSESLAVLARQRLRIALEQDLAARQEQHAVADLLDFVHVVRGPEDAARRRLSAKARMRGADVARRRRIERGGGLVEQQQRGLVEHRLGERHARLLAGREHAALGVAEAPQVELLDQRSRCAPSASRTP